MKRLVIFLFCVIVGIYFLSQKDFFGIYYRLKYAQPISKWQKPFVDDGVEYQEMRPLDLLIPQPKDNPYTQIKALLGEFLFEEPLLSSSKNISCSSCHNKELGFSDGLKTSFGHLRQRGLRNAPSVIMSGFCQNLFWDGRAQGLESQILGPIHNPIEMANDINSALKNIKDSYFYQNLFILAFGKASITLDQKSLLGKDFISTKDLQLLHQKPTLDATIYLTTQNLLKAIATYERSLIPKNSRFNRFLKGDYQALNNQEIYGLHLFRTKGRCMNCHYGMALSDCKFHHIGLSFYGRKLQDLGRYEITNDPQDLGRFKTPSLINVGKTAPYMHNGIFPHLRGVLNMYNIGFGEKKERLNPNLEGPKISPLIHSLNLSEKEIQALEAFLKTL